MSAAGIFAVASSIFIVSVFYILGSHVEFFLQQLEGNMGITVFINEDFTPTDRLQLERRIRDLPQVEGITFVSREEVLEGWREFIGSESLMAGFERNSPFRDAFEITLVDLAYHDSVIHSLEIILADGAGDIQEASETAAILSTLSGIVQVVFFALILVLGVISVIIIVNTIRITVNARKDQIFIMKWIGATDWFIRWPFVIEGILIGLIGGVIPAVLIRFTYGRVVTAVATIPQLQFIEFLPAGQVYATVFAFALILGMLIGFIGSFTSVKRHLKV